MSALNPSTPSSKPPSKRYPAFAALRHRDFRLLWMGQIVSVTGSQMQLAAVNWHVWLLTKSAFALGMVGFFRGAPIILCSLAGGVFADAVDRKTRRGRFSRAIKWLSGRIDGWFGKGRDKDAAHLG